MKLHSTGALTPEQHARQDELYAEKHEYDYLIIGTGIAALTVGSLLANAGHKICMLEAHDIPGGYAHNFKMGDYFFCAQIHYVWGGGPGDTLSRFTKKIGLEKELEFLPYDATGYDHMVMPDGKRIKIPYGFDRLADNLEEAYPGHRKGVEKFLKIVDRLYTEERRLPSRVGLSLIDVVTKALKFRYMIKYRNKTLQQVFDACHLSQEVQSVLSANAGDFMLPPEELSILAYAGLFGGYNSGAYYPKKHYKYYIERLARFITEHDGCHIFYETPVTKIEIENNRVARVETEGNKIFTAKTFICNADPQSTAKKIIGWDLFPKKYHKALSYDYSSAGTVVYLGLKNIDLKKLGFGSFNIWHLEQWDMNKTWKEQKSGNFDKPWFFISTASLHTHEAGTTPENGEIIELATYSDFTSFRALKKRDIRLYRKKKKEVANKMIELVEKHYIPNLRDHIAVKVVGTSSTNFDYVRAPYGNAYGSTLNTTHLNIGRLTAETPWPNFWWCNASSGSAGFHGTTSTGMGLYTKLTGDIVFPEDETPNTETLVKYARNRWKDMNG